MEIQAKNERMMNEILRNHSLCIGNLLKSIVCKKIFF